MDEKLINFCQKLGIPAFADEEIQCIKAALPKNIVLERIMQGDCIYSYNDHIRDIKQVIDPVNTHLSPEYVNKVVVQDHQDEINGHLSKNTPWIYNSGPLSTTFAYNIPDLIDLIIEFTKRLFTQKNTLYQRNLNNNRPIAWRHYLTENHDSSFNILLQINNYSPNLTDNYLDYCIKSEIKLPEIEQLNQELRAIDMFFSHINADLVENALREQKEKIIDSLVRNRPMDIYRQNYALNHIENDHVHKKLKSTIESKAKQIELLECEQFAKEILPYFGRQIRLNVRSETYGYSGLDLQIRISIYLGSIF